MSIVGMISLTASGISNANLTKNRLVAYFLAQEGVETVRSVRDSRMIADGASGWNNFVSDMAPCAGACRTDPSALSPAFVACTSPSACPRLQYASSTPQGYNYNAVLPPINFASPYTRAIIVTTPFAGNANAARVVSVVSWNQGTASTSITMSEYLYNWIQ